jgi:transglutaminase-like putative cysteine protease
VRYEIAHELRLTYSAPVWEHHLEARLTPQHNAHQRLLAADVATDPLCELRTYDDYFGNRVHYGGIIAPHDHLTVRLRAQVDTLLNNPFDYTALAAAREPEWLAERLREQPRLADYVLHRSPLTADLRTLPAAATPAPAREPAHTLLESVMATLEWIGGAIEYVPGFSHAPATLEDVLARGSGGCQDLTHLLISIVRTWGVPARYVMGYQDPGYAEDEDDGQRPHAWAEVVVPGAGWRGVDPATRLVANETYVAVAIGRDAADAVPLKAVFKSAHEADAAEADTEVVVEVTRDQ